MTNQEIRQLFEELRFQKEEETIEFKKAEHSFDSSDLGNYFSALCNETNLKGKRCGWLIFGVHDKTRAIIGTSYRNSPEKLQSLKHEIAQKTTAAITFTNIFELNVTDEGREKRVILFQIPPAPQGLPVAFDGHYYGRDGESLVALNIQEIMEIKNQTVSADWSEQIIPQAALSDLDEEAIHKARFEFKKENPDITALVDEWDNEKFLDKAKITINGAITNAALILLGKPDSSQLLKPALAEITWILKDSDGVEVDYKHFGMPLLLNVDKVLARIRNLTFRYMPDNSLFPDEITQYDNYVIREALHNCIAHQEYALQERINVIETPDALIFANGGAFIPKTVEAVIIQDAPQRYYRNKFLCAAMVSLNMIDTIGSGIRRMYINQRKRYFPLPDYKITEKEVSVKIYGKVINPNYVKLLKNNSDITLMEIMALDHIQKGYSISDDMAKLLRQKKLIEGRKSNLFLSDTVAMATAEMAQYIQNKAFDKKYYKDLTVELLKKKKLGASKNEIKELLWNKLSNTLTHAQKNNYIRNMLHEMVKDNIIVSKARKYYLVES